MTAQNVVITGFEGVPPWVSDRTMKEFTSAVSGFVGQNNPAMAKALANANKNNASATNDAADASQSLGKTLGVLGNKLEDTATSLNSMEMNTKSFLQVLTSSGLKGAALFTPLADVVERLKDDWQGFSNSGQRFNGSMLEMATTINSAGMSFKSFQQTMEEGQQAIAAMGTHQFLEARKGMITTMREVGFFGMSLKEVNESYGKFLELQKGQGGLLTQSSAKLNKSFRELTQNASAVSELYGKDRDKILKDTMDKLGETSSAITQMVLKNENGQGAVDTYQKMMTQVSAMPKEFGNDLQDMINREITAGPGASAGNKNFQAFQLAGLTTEDFTKIAQAVKKGDDKGMSEGFANLNQHLANISPDRMKTMQYQNILGGNTSMSGLISGMQQAQGLQGPNGPRQLDLEHQNVMAPETKTIQNMASTIEGTVTPALGAFAGALEKGAKGIAGHIENFNKGLDSFVASRPEEKMHTLIGDVGMAEIKAIPEQLASFAGTVKTGFDSVVAAIQTKVKDATGIEVSADAIAAKIKPLWEDLGKNYGILGQGGAVLLATTAAASIVEGIGSVLGVGAVRPAASGGTAAATTTPPISGIPALDPAGISTPGESLFSKIFAADGLLVNALKLGVGAGIVTALTAPEFTANFAQSIVDGFRRAFQGHAEGGEVKAKDVSVVGEKGPELFSSDKSGSITPNDEINKSLDRINKAQSSFLENWSSYANQFKVEGKQPINYQSEGYFNQGKDGMSPSDEARRAMLFKQYLQFQKKQIKDESLLADIYGDSNDLEGKSYLFDKETMLPTYEKLNENLTTLNENGGLAAKDPKADPNKKVDDGKPKGDDKTVPKTSQQIMEENAKKAQKQADDLRKKQEKAIEQNKQFSQNYRNQGQPTAPAKKEDNEIKNQGQGWKPDAEDEKYYRKTHPDEISRRITPPAKPVEPVNKSDSLMEEFLKQNKGINIESKEGKEKYQEYMQKIMNDHLDEMTRIHHQVIIDTNKHMQRQQQTTAKPTTPTTPSSKEQADAAAKAAAEANKNQKPTTPPPTPVQPVSMTDGLVNKKLADTIGGLDDSVKKYHDAQKFLAEKEKRDGKPTERNAAMQEYHDLRKGVYDDLAPQLKNLDLSKVSGVDQEKIAGFMDEVKALQKKVVENAKAGKSTSKEEIDKVAEDYKEEKKEN